MRDIPSFGAFFYTYELLIGHPNKLNYRGDYGMQSKEQILDFSKIVVSLNSDLIEICKNLGDIYFHSAIQVC